MVRRGLTFGNIDVLLQYDFQFRFWIKKEQPSCFYYMGIGIDFKSIFSLTSQFPRKEPDVMLGLLKKRRN